MADCCSDKECAIEALQARQAGTLRIVMRRSYTKSGVGCQSRLIVTASNYVILAPLLDSTSTVFPAGSLLASPCP